MVSNEVQQRYIYELFISLVSSNNPEVGSDPKLTELGLSSSVLRALLSYSNYQLMDLARLVSARDAIKVNVNYKALISLGEKIINCSNVELKKLEEDLNKRLDDDFHRRFQSRFVLKEFVKNIGISLSNSSLGATFYRQKNIYPTGLLRIVTGMPASKMRLFTDIAAEMDLVCWKADGRSLDLVVANFKRKCKSESIQEVLIRNYASKNMIHYVMPGEKISDQALTGLREAYKVTYEKGQNRRPVLTNRELMDLKSLIYRDVFKSDMSSAELPREYEVWENLQKKTKFRFDFLWSLANDLLNSYRSDQELNSEVV